MINRCHWVFSGCSSCGNRLPAAGAAVSVSRVNRRITTSGAVLAAAIGVALAGGPVAGANPFEPIPDPTQLHVGDCITVTRGNPMDPNDRKYFLRTTCRPSAGGLYQVTSIVGFADTCPDQSAENEAANFRACYQPYR